MEKQLKFKSNRKHNAPNSDFIKVGNRGFRHGGEFLRGGVFFRRAHIFLSISRNTHPGLDHYLARELQNRTVPGTYLPVHMHDFSGSVQKCLVCGNYSPAPGHNCTAPVQKCSAHGDYSPGLEHNCTALKIYFPGAVYYFPGSVQKCSARGNYFPVLKHNCTGLKHYFPTGAHHFPAPVRNCPARGKYFAGPGEYCSIYKLNHYTSGYRRGRGVDTGSEFRRI